MIGIEDISLYAGQLSLSIFDLAKARGETEEYVTTNLMCDTRSVYPVWEDSVTLAVNAAKPLTDRHDLSDIQLLIVSTESAVDFGKPVSTWVQRYCSLSANCRNFEIKHACYGATGALKMAANWVAQTGKKALVVSADYSRSHIGSDMEFISGGCGVALLVSQQPDILQFEPNRAGYWTTEIADTFRPTSRDEIGNDQLSLYSYLDALEGSYLHFEDQFGTQDLLNHFKAQIYHAPFPAMTWQAHRTLLAQVESMDKQTKKEDFDRRVAPGLTFNQQIGTTYGASNFVGLLSHLSKSDHLKKNDLLSLFSYGSGCQGEFYEATVGEIATEKVQSLEVEKMLRNRAPLTVSSYEELEVNRSKAIDAKNLNLNVTDDPIYQEAYQGKSILTLQGIDNFNRIYSYS